METAAQPLSIESFSYSWLINLKPSLESLDDSVRASLDAFDEAYFIEMDPRMPPSKRFFTNSQDLIFDFPISQTPLSLVHADQLFSNGYVMPLFVDPLKMEAFQASTPSLLPTPNLAVPVAKTRCSSLRRCRKLSKRIFHNYFDFLRPLYQKIRGCKLSSRAATGIQEFETSPRISKAYSSPDEWRKSCDSESSINEAVLHCKKSFGK
ncbi:hypothetical protein CFOL_v3_36031 [Cephalotus follicularis]|uniref:Membrane-associated kinase regulator 6 n=1 Tax=Cephalotus follicularis TaxID=3775 RepID=A0A1Q3DK09_CEPFO|nr:hypothetical protein CFOL_v3_36031 [Cephalotus follicularis]